MYNTTDKNETLSIVLWVSGVVLSILLIIALLMFTIPVWGVWSANKKGQAEYAQAEQNRKIKILEAEAKRDSAVLEAQAEIERAKGVQQANAIIADGLKGNEEYLRYLWIANLEKGTGREVIYIPTEANLPILEAKR